MSILFFIAVDVISVFKNITEKNCLLGNAFFIRDDNHIVLRRQITNKLYIREVREWTRIDHELHTKPFFTSFFNHFHSGFKMNIIAS